MNVEELFLAYAADFELTYVDNQWSRLERHFSPQATYVTRGQSTGGINAKGRDQVLAALEKSVDEFDRTCDRRTLELTAQPLESADRITFEWRARYAVAGTEDLVISGTETARFDTQGRIVELIDTYYPGMEVIVLRWLAEVRKLSRPQP